MNVNDIIVEAEKVDTGERVTGFVCGCEICRTTEGLTNFDEARPIGRLTFANGKVGGIAVYTDTLSSVKTSDKSAANAEPVDLKPVVRGEWIFTKNDGILDYYKCSRCENKIEVYFDKLPTEHNFCHKCGADMRDGEQEEEDE